MIPSTMGVVIEPITSDRRIHSTYAGRIVDGAASPQTTNTAARIHGHLGNVSVKSQGISKPNITINAIAVVMANFLRPGPSNSGISCFIVINLGRILASTNHLCRFRADQVYEEESFQRPDNPFLFA